MDRLGMARMFGSTLWQNLPGSSRERSFSRRVRRFSEALNEEPARRYLRWIGIFNESQRADLYNDEFLASLPGSDPLDFIAAQWLRAKDREPITQASLGDMFTYLPCDLNVKVDVASMAHSLECRQPMLDHRLAELAIGMPLSMKHRAGRGKRILQKAFGDLLPAEIFKRRKMGFGVPVAQWLRHDLKEMLHDTLLATDARCLEFFSAEAISELVKQHESERFDHANRLWALLFLELWLREWK
jgi:asparagine synthase (glutamine-hydrolysing)